MDGWIKSYRRTLENPIVCKDSDYLAVWMYLLWNATYKPIEKMFGGKKITLVPGQLITGRKSISEKFNIHESKVQRILKMFENEQQIEQQTSNLNRLISIVNWEEYQDNEQQIEQPLNNKRTTTEQQMNTNKNIKNNKEYKKTLLSEIYADLFPEINAEYIEITKAFQNLFRANLAEAGASTKGVDSAKGIWIDSVRLMIESDGYSLVDLRGVYQFLQKDAFWKQNILSTSKLREQMAKLKLKMKNGNGSTREATSWTELAEVIADLG